MSSEVPGLFAAGECGAGLHGANRLGGNSLSDLLVFGKRAGEYAARFAKDNSLGKVNPDEVKAAEKLALEPFEHDGAEGPFAVQYALQEMMQELVGIVRQETGNVAGAGSHSRAENAQRPRGRWGNREYNGGWHTAIDLHHLLTVSESHHSGGAGAKKRVGEPIFATTIPPRTTIRPIQHPGPEARRWWMQLTREPLPAMPAN